MGFTVLLLHPNAESYNVHRVFGYKDSSIISVVHWLVNTFFQKEKRPRNAQTLFPKGTRNENTPHPP